MRRWHQSLGLEIVAYGKVDDVLTFEGLHGCQKRRPEVAHDGYHGGEIRGCRAAVEVGHGCQAEVLYSAVVIVLVAEGYVLGLELIVDAVVREAADCQFGLVGVEIVLKGVLHHLS